MDLGTGIALGSVILTAGALALKFFTPGGVNAAIRDEAKNFEKKHTEVVHRVIDMQHTINETAANIKESTHEQREMAKTFAVTNAKLQTLIDLLEKYLKK